MMNRYRVVYFVLIAGLHCIAPLQLLAQRSYVSIPLNKKGASVADAIQGNVSQQGELSGRNGGMCASPLSGSSSDRGSSSTWLCNNASSSSDDGVLPKPVVLSADLTSTPQAATDLYTNAPTSADCPQSNATNLCITKPPYNADPTGTRDATAAFQNAINALASTGGTIWIPDGYYTFPSRLQDTSGANAQLLLPRITNYTSPLPRIALKGINSPNYRGKGGVVLGTNLSAGSFIGGYDADSNGTGNDWPGFTNVQLVMENIEIALGGRDGSNKSSVTAINANYVMSADLKHLAIFQSGVPLSSGYGVRMPLLGNEFENLMDDIQVAGFTNEYQLTEHTRAGSLYAAGGTNCFIFDPGDNNASHRPASYQGNGMTVGYLWGEACQNLIVGGSNPAALYVAFADVERNPYTVYDPGNNLHGIINFNIPDTANASRQSSGRCTPHMSGGTNLQMNSVFCPAAKGGSASTDGSFSVASSSGDASINLGTSSRSYASAYYGLQSNGSDSYAWITYNGNNDASHAGVVGLIDSTQAALGTSATKPVYPWLVDKAGDICFAVPYSSTNLATCQGAPYVLLAGGGAALGFESRSSAAWGVPSSSSSALTFMADSLPGWEKNDHLFAMQYTAPSDGTPGGSSLGIVTFGKTWKNSTGVPVWPVCRLVGLDLSDEAFGIHAGVNTRGTTVGKSIALKVSNRITAGQSVHFQVECSADQEQ